MPFTIEVVDVNSFFGKLNLLHQMKKVMHSKLCLSMRVNKLKLICAAATLGTLREKEWYQLNFCLCEALFKTIKSICQWPFNIRSNIRCLSFVEYTVTKRIKRKQVLRVTILPYLWPLCLSTYIVMCYWQLL